jgi:hypothetical protein
MKPIGGYFELELNKGEEYHKDAIKLNTGRNCLEYIIKASSIKNIYIPAYTCNVILEPIKKLKLKYEFYSINQYLDPLFNKLLKANEALLYTNYFGIKDITIIKLSEMYKENLIVDNSQSFFSKPLNILGTFYSPRKFFGVPDGGYLYCKKKSNEHLLTDLSYKRMEHLIRRLDTTAELGYSAFVKNDKALSNHSIKQMSNLTSALLKSINYKAIQEKRISNYNYLHDKLKALNELKIDLNISSIPMVYPFLNTKKDLHKYLIDKKLFVPKYWEETANNEILNKYEKNLASLLIPLSIDHRYDINDMETILKYLQEIL